MEGELIPGLAGGDIPPGIKREHESIDDFEHLERDSRPMDARAAIDDFLQAERGPTPQELLKSQDLLTEKFTDSESETGSPLHHPQRPVQQPPPPPLEEPLLPDLAFNKPLPSSKFELEKDPKVISVPEKNNPEKPASVLPHSVPDFIKETILPAQSEVSSLLQKEPLKPASTEAPKPPQVEPVKVVANQPAHVEKPKPVQPAKTTAHIIEAEVIFCQMGLDAWFDPQRLHPKVESLIYWRDPVWSGAALGAGLALMVALASCSVVSVLAYCSLLVLLGTAGFRIYKSVMQAVHKTNDGHPFKVLLETEIAVSSERAQQMAAAATAHLNAATHELRRLFLVEDLVDSLKFGVLLWCLTYVGACFNGITLIILGWIGLFTLPKAYEANKAQVDANLELARAKINEITAKVRAAVPLGKKPESEKDK